MSGLELRSVRAGRGTFSLGPVTFEVAAGEATVLLGPSGAGKTTLLRAVAGFLPLTGGGVVLDGEAIDARPPERRRFGFVPPNLGLFADRRVRQNVRYPIALRGADDARARTDRWLARFRLEPLADRYPHELSSGERQRVAMARALASEPRALLWDEPLGALDVESRDELLRLLVDLLDTERLPLLLVTHDPPTALAVASRMVVLEGGAVRFDGRPDALAEAALDRFTARFLGYANLFTSEELARAGDAPLARTLRRAAGPGGVAVPPEALHVGGAEPGREAAAVRSVRRTAGGWSVALSVGPLAFHLTVPPGVPGFRRGDRVDLGLDPAALKPLAASGTTPPGG